jgi:hypothetical protein
MFFQFYSLFDLIAIIKLGEVLTVHRVSLSSLIKKLWIAHYFVVMGVPQVNQSTDETCYNFCRCQLSSSSKREMRLVTILSGIRPFEYIKTLFKGSAN